MKVSLFDMEKFVKANLLQEVTNPVMLDKGNIPTPDGLLSTIIFGTTIKERNENWAYIDLYGPYLHPLVYTTLKKLDRRFGSIVNGSRRYKLNGKGELIEDEEAGETGLEFIYRNWEKFKFRGDSEEDSDEIGLIRKERLQLLKSYKKEELFVFKWPVIPAAFRDINLQDQESGKVSYHEINTMYSKIIRLSSLMKDASFTFVLNNTKAQVQETIVDIYDYFKGRIEKKDGILKKSLLGKSIDYGSRLVIAAPVYNFQSYKDLKVDFYHAGIPLANCCSAFTPFIIKWCKDFFMRECELTGNKFPMLDKDGNVKEYIELKSPATVFTDEYIKKLLDTFIHSYTDRFQPIKLPTEDGRYIGMAFKGRFMEAGLNEGNGIKQRPLTLTDLFYMAAYDVCKDKHVYITRYPLTDYLGTFPSKIYVMSTEKTTRVNYYEVEYDAYPVIDLNIPKEQVQVEFVDVIRMSNVYLAALGGD